MKYFILALLLLIQICQGCKNVPENFNDKLSNNNNNNNNNHDRSNNHNNVELEITLCYHDVLGRSHAIQFADLTWNLRINDYESDGSSTLNENGKLTKTITLKKSGPRENKGFFSSKKEESFLIVKMVNDYVMVLQEGVKDIVNYKIPITPKISRDGNIEITYTFIGEKSNGINAANNFLFTYIIITKAALEVQKMGVTKDELKQVQLNIGRDANIIDFLKFKPGIDAYYTQATKTITLPYMLSWIPIYILHEYGHHIMSNIYGPTYVGMGGGHEPCPKTPQDPKLAWSEGYAEAFGLILSKRVDFIKTPQNPGRRMSANYLWSDGSFIEEIHVEYYNCDKTIMLADEGRVMAAIIDLVDPNNDKSDNAIAKDIISESKGKISPNHFGNPLYSDENFGNTLGEDQALVYFLRATEDLPSIPTINNFSLTSYMIKILALPLLTPAQKYYACKIFDYNYLNNIDCEFLKPTPTP